MKLSLPATSRSVRPGKLLCIGRNYAKHAAEMQSAVPDEPLIFLKPSSALVSDGGSIVLPPESQDVHHEVELVAVVGREGRHVKVDEALDYVAAYAVGIDVTARDLQAEAKSQGHPWSIAKGFDTFAPLGPLVDAEQVADPQDLEVLLEVNGETRQRAGTGDMIFSVAELVAACSRFFTLQPGDLIYTGTPEGVGPLHDGDEVMASVTGLPALHVSVRRNT